MKAVVLAAGRGSRMGPYTADRPKCLMEIAGRSLLDRQVAALRAAGADEVAVVTGWQPDAFAATGLRLFHNPRWARTTMVDSLAAADAWLSAGPVLVSYGDIVYSAATARRLAHSRAPLALVHDPDWLALWSRRLDDPFADAERFRQDASGRLIDIGGRAHSVEDAQGQYIGLLRFTPDAWAVLQARRAAGDLAGLDMTGALGHLVRTCSLPVMTVPVDGPWCEFDRPADLEVGLDVVRRLDAAGVAR
ncbi:NTP transferase domain-containing protein [Streptomyces sp. G45]|uniref:phosphocholine cytidylyltransferase family protein n=1 Tax=Streptomyces sp. G45 TaxID=3406627 RepID=UPI003C154789